MPIIKFFNSNYNKYPKQSRWTNKISFLNLNPSFAITKALLILSGKVTEMRVFRQLLPINIFKYPKILILENFHLLNKNI